MRNFLFNFFFWTNELRWKEFVGRKWELIKWLSFKITRSNISKVEKLLLLFSERQIKLLATVAMSKARTLDIAKGSGCARSLPGKVKRKVENTHFPCLYIVIVVSTHTLISVCKGGWRGVSFLPPFDLTTFCVFALVYSRSKRSSKMITLEKIMKIKNYVVEHKKLRKNLNPNKVFFIFFHFFNQK